MDNLLDFLKGFNIQTILSLGAIVWYFNRHTEVKLESMQADMGKMEAELKELVKVQSARSDQLYQMFIGLQKETKDMFIELQKETKNMFIEMLKDRK